MKTLNALALPSQPPPSAPDTAPARISLRRVHRLTPDQFHTLAGSDLHLRMLRNRQAVTIRNRAGAIKVSLAIVDWLDDNATGFFWLQEGIDEKGFIVGFENECDMVHFTLRYSGASV